MLSWIREKFGSVVIGGIITFIAFVFVFYGVFSPKSTRGLHEGAVAGTVNGDPISIPEFNRELNRRMEFFKNLGGGKLSDEQLKSFRVREGAFQELANRKLLIQEAKRQNHGVADDEIRERIREIPNFQKDGKFDLMTYKQVLEANNHTPASFERLVREDLSLQDWESYFRDRIHTSEEEVKREFMMTHEKRNIKYVLLSNEAPKPAQPPSEKSKAAAASAAPKAPDMETRFKENEKLAEQIMGLLKADKASDSAVNQLLKSKGLQSGSAVEVKSTGLISLKQDYLPGIGEAKDLMRDAFSPQSTIYAKKGGKAKKYNLAGRILVALVTESESPDLTRLSQDRESLLQQMNQRKVRAFYQGWMEQLNHKAKIDMNPAVVGANE